MRKFAARAPRNYLLSKNRRPLAASAQENIRRKKQILHRILRSGGLPYVSMPSPSRLGSAQNLRFSDANSFANMFYIKNSLILYMGEIFLDLIRLQKSHWQNRMFSYVEAALRGVFYSVTMGFSSGAGRSKPFQYRRSSSSETGRALGPFLPSLAARRALSTGSSALR